VLCAEDDVPVATLLKQALENEGYQVECARDGRAALARAAEDIGFFDLVVTDHQMPEMSGLHLVKSLRELGFPGRIMVHSSQLRESVAEAYRTFTVDRILTKPVPLPQILEAVREILP
jgi:CheY-like chemotaxis protein